MSSEKLAALNGAAAQVSQEVGGVFSAHGGAVTGRQLELVPNVRIVQSWRTEEFAAADPDSILELRLEPDGDGTRLVLRHTELPPGTGATYRQGWEDHYFVYMRKELGA